METPTPESIGDEKRSKRDLYEGIAQGGPLDGIEIQSRFPRGFVAVDKVNGKAWVYHHRPRLFLKDAFYLDPDDSGNTERELDHEKRWTAAEDIEYDIIAITAEVF